MAYIHLYKDNPTAGGTNGTLVSEGDGSSPVTVTLNATNNEESSAITLALRCESGYQTVGNTTITPTGTTASKWALSSNGTTWSDYGSALIISTTIGATNTLIYAKAKASSDETPMNDTSVDFQIQATIGAV